LNSRGGMPTHQVFVQLEKRKPNAVQIPCDVVSKFVIYINQYSAGKE
jgi:hypothetical protein